MVYTLNPAPERNESHAIMIGNKPLRNAISDVTSELSKLTKDFESIGTESEEAILQAECECCGLKEECTKEYISEIRNSFSGKWICGLCSEAVKDNLDSSDGISMAIEEAVSNHTKIVREFNATRINPKLAFTWAMKDIAKRSSENQRRNLLGEVKIVRSFSCAPKFD